MIYKNVEFHNVSELIENEDGSVSWLRIPQNVYDGLEEGGGRRMASGSTGVELRFVIKGEKAVIRMCSSGSGRFHVYRGGIQGGWEDHESHKNVGTKIEEFEIKRSENPDKLRFMTKECGYDWDSEVVRVIFDLGSYKIYDISGDIEPPKKEQCPKKTILFYGSSITHGSNALDMSHSWSSVVGHKLNMDVLNYGMAGSCKMEPEFVNYIADLGKNDKWNIAVLELGVNVLGWEEDKFLTHVKNTIKQIASQNHDKPIFVISPFYLCDETFDENCKASRWREIIEETVKEFDYKNVCYIKGTELLGDMSGISGDFVHPNIYGVQQIAEKLYQKIKEII